MLAVETSERLVHRTLMARMPEALAATHLHPHATCAVAELLLHNVMGAREAGRVVPERVMPGAGAAPPITVHAFRASLALALRLDAEDRASAPPPPAPMEEDGFRSFLGSLGMAHHADRLRAEAVESVEDLALLDVADIIACGVPAADATRLEAALAAARGPTAAEESKSSPPPPPPGKVLVDEILDDAAARAAALETSLTAHQEELKRLKAVLHERGVPDGYVCPITVEVMEDPCIAADGNSYERRAIQAWFDRGKRTSPKTNEELPHTFLVPNNNLKSAIQDFLEEVRQFEPR